MHDLTYTDLDDQRFTALLSDHAGQAAAPATPDPPVAAPDEEGGEGDDQCVISLSVFPRDGSQFHVSAYLTEPVTPAQLVAAVRQCAAGALAQLNIDPRTSGGPWPHG